MAAFETFCWVNLWRGGVWGGVFFFFPFPPTRKKREKKKKKRMVHLDMVGFKGGGELEVNGRKVEGWKRDEIGRGTRIGDGGLDVACVRTLKCGIWRLGFLGALRKSSSCFPFFASRISIVALYLSI